MATYLKPTSKLFGLSSRASTELNLTDLMCPVCRGILIEPVTLPCEHSLCLRCLKGTIQHNSLTCPLCRVRVGSWLRTATKSATLVNEGLWKLIKTRFSKEVQAKHDGEETELDSGFVATTTKILSAAGEIRREYEAQLHLAQEEIRKQREAERIASEALIRKIQAEERQQINQLTNDHVLAKNLAKRQLCDKAKVKEKHTNPYCQGEELVREIGGESSVAETDLTALVKSKNGTEWNSNVALISKLRAERYASEMKSYPVSTCKGSSSKFESLMLDEGETSVSKSAKQLVTTKIAPQVAQSYMSKPSCSNSKIYGSQSKEELQVPSDVLSRKKKSLDVEVCLAVGEDDQRIGSAESSGSHDSINIEIHHFKPIKAMPRTPMRTMPDGRQIDPKLIRVVAILKRAQNVIPKPPTAMQLKRLSGCSYSAFRGKSKKLTKQDLRSMASNALQEQTEGKASSTSHCLSQSQTNPTKLQKSQISETVRRLDLSSEISYDGNKNYTKNINRLINGTKVSKKLILDEDVGVAGANKVSNSDNSVKFQRRKHNSLSNDKEGLIMDKNTIHSGDEAPSSNPSASDHPSSCASRQISGTTPAVENIAERIKKRKMSRARNHAAPETPLKKRCVAESEKKGKPTGSVRKSVHTEEALTSSRSITKRTTTTRLDAKQKKLNYRVSDDADHYDENIDSQREFVQNRDANEPAVNMIGRNAVNVGSAAGGTTCGRRWTRNCVNVREKYFSNHLDLDNEEGQEEDDEGVMEQKRIERLVLQEKKDFELAQRLQAKFDEMERISGRTRGSRRGGGGVGLNPKNIEKVLSSDGRGIRERFTKQLLVQDKDSSDVETNKRRVTRRQCV